MPKSNTKRTKKLIETQERKSSIFSIPELSEISANHKAFSSFANFPKFEVLVNVAFLIEIILGGLRIQHGYSPEDIKQNFETHRVLMTTLSSPDFRFFFSGISCFISFPYSGTFKIENMRQTIEKYTKSNLKGAKLIWLTKNASPEAVDKFIKAKILSLKGTISSYPLFYPGKLESFYDISIKDLTIEDLSGIFPFPNHSQEAINYLFKIFQEKKIIDPIKSISKIEESLGIQRFSATMEEELEIDESQASDDEEREMIQKIKSL